MYQNPKRFFTREMLLMIGGFVGIVLLAIFSGMGGIAIIFGLLISALIVLTMLVMFVISIIYVLKFIGDNDNKQTAIMYLVNIVFSFLVLAGFTVFYLTLGVAAFAILAPLS